MSVTVHSYLRILISKLFHLFMWCALLVGSAYGHTARSQPGGGRVPDVLERLKQDTDASTYVRLIEPILASHKLLFQDRYCVHPSRVGSDLHIIRERGFETPRFSSRMGY